MPGEEHDDDQSLEQLAESLIQTGDSTPAQPNVPPQSQQTPPTIQPPTQSQQDVLMAELSKEFDGLPEGMTRAEYVAEVIRINKEANEAATLRQQLAELQARQTAAAMQQVQQGQQTQATGQQQNAQAQAELDEELPWKPVPVDPAFKLMVQFDGASGYSPKNPANPMHISAAQEMNRRAQYEAQFTNALLDDPEGVVGRLSAKQIKALEKKFEERWTAFEQQFKPVQDHFAETRQEAETRAFSEQHAEKLFVNGALSPVGNLTNSLFVNAQSNGNPISWETALKIAESSIPAAPVQQAPQSQSISKAGNKRFKDTLSAQSRVVNRIETQEQEFDSPTFKQLEKQFEKKFGVQN